MKEVAVLPPPGPEEVQQTLAGRTAEVEERVRAGVRENAGAVVPRGPGGGGGRRIRTAANCSRIPMSICCCWWNRTRTCRRARASPHSCRACGIRGCGPAIPCIRWRIASSNTTTTPSSPSACWTGASWPGTRRCTRLWKKSSGSSRPGAATSLARQIAGLAEGRRAKYQNTIYHLEPNVKETPGGLRDLQTTRWLLMLEPREGTPDLSAAFNFLSGVRLRLHELAGRDQNALSFDAQESLERTSGVVDARLLSPGPRGGSGGAASHRGLHREGRARCWAASTNGDRAFRPASSRYRAIACCCGRTSLRRI